jgi:hypothetical protein
LIFRAEFSAVMLPAMTFAMSPASWIQIPATGPLHGGLPSMIPPVTLARPRSAYFGANARGGVGMPAK